MTKKRSKGLFVVFAILLAILLIASFVNFTYPFAISGNYYSYSNFVSNLSLGQDVGKSVRILYRANQRQGQDNSNYNQLRQSTINQLINIAKSYGFYDVTASEYGNNGILVQVGNILNKEDENNIISIIGNPADISFSTENDSSADKKIAGAVDVKSIEMQEGTSNDGTNTTAYYITITFKNPNEIYEKLNGKETLYAFLGDTAFLNLSLSSGLEGFKENGQITFSNSGITDRATANRYVNMVRTGLLDLQLTGLESESITPSYGTWATISVCVVSFLVVLAMFIFLIVKYKHMGWLACFNMLFLITIGLFIIQSIPIFHLNFSGLLAMLVMLILTADMLMIILEKAKQHYNAGTQLFVAFNMAKKETWARILITFAILFATGVVSVFMPAMAVQSFGWVVMVFSVVGAFTTLAFMRLFINMYLPLNPQKGEKCNFYKGGKNA